MARKRGDKPIPEAIVRACRSLAGRANTREAARQLGISASSVRRIWAAQVRDEESEVRSPLAVGERWCDPPERCAEGHLVYIMPCRLCALLAGAKERPMERISIVCPRCRHDQAVRRGKQWR